MINRFKLYIIGLVLAAQAVFLLPSGIISLSHGEWTAAKGIFITMAILMAVSLPIVFKKPKTTLLYGSDGFLIAAVSWILMSVFGALPFFISGAIPSFLDSIFETVSGFTTTGASILNDIEALPMGLLFWRSFTHWIGGMGVLVFILSIISLTGGHSIHLMRAEAPGPSISKFVPKIKQSAKILYLMYVFLTVLEVFLLCLGGMPLFDSVVNSFATAGTGGFSIKNTSIGAYNSVYADYVIGIFMILFGINFNAYFLLLIRKFKTFFKREELRVYLAIIAVSVIAITLNLYKTVYAAFPDAFSQAFFHVSSIITTTGFTISDFNAWPEMSRYILFALMFIGACAGSTGGGIKIARFIIAFKSIKKELNRLLHPRAVDTVRFDGKPLDTVAVSSVSTYFLLYAFIYAVSVLLITLNGFSFETSFSSVAACLNNIGPGLGLVGPIGNYSGFSVLSKLVLTVNMLIGRLEIIPILMLFAPGAWKRENSMSAAENTQKNR